MFSGAEMSQCLLYPAPLVSFVAAFTTCTSASDFANRIIPLGLGDVDVSIKTWSYGADHFEPTAVRPTNTLPQSHKSVLTRGVLLLINVSPSFRAFPVPTSGLSSRPAVGTVSFNAKRSSKRKRCGDASVCRWRLLS